MLSLNIYEQRVSELCGDLMVTYSLLDCNFLSMDRLALVTVASPAG